MAEPAAPIIREQAGFTPAVSDRILPCAKLVKPGEMLDEVITEEERAD